MARDDDLKTIIDDLEGYDESREGTALGMLTEFYSRKFLSTAIVVWANALVMTGVALLSAILFFRTDVAKEEILYATIFLAAFIWTASIKMFAWMAVNRNSIAREVKRLEIRVVELARAIEEHKLRP
jgi:hypothetical protein